MQLYRYIFEEKNQIFYFRCTSWLSFSSYCINLSILYVVQSASSWRESITKYLFESNRRKIKNKRILVVYLHMCGVVNRHLSPFHFLLDTFINWNTGNQPKPAINTYTLWTLLPRKCNHGQLAILYRSLRPFHRRFERIIMDYHNYSYMIIITHCPYSPYTSARPNAISVKAYGDSSFSVFAKCRGRTDDPWCTSVNYLPWSVPKNTPIWTLVTKFLLNITSPRFLWGPDHHQNSSVRSLQI